MTEFAPSKTRMAGQALKEHLNPHKGMVKHIRNSANLSANGSDKLTHIPGIMTHGFAEQRLI
jgi:hypothetical protein